MYKHCQSFMSGKEADVGRSMVETLGVLAVMGVLSVVGVMGYSVAMDNHYANELLRQISIRAASCESQVALGKTDLTIEGFDDYAGYTFSAEYDSDNKKYKITATAPVGKPISKSMCNHMKNSSNSIKMTAPENCSTSNAFVTMAFDDKMGQEQEINACNNNCESPNLCLPNGEK